MSRQAIRHTHAVPTLILALLTLAQSSGSDAMPVFARKYNLSCSACHVAFPRLNAFGEQFIANNLKLPNWKESATRDVGDPLLVLPESVPLAIRAQAFVQSRNATAIDETSGATTANASTDIQSPYLIKLLSSAPLSEHITYYFYGIFAEKGGNGETLIEDAWFRHDDVFGSGLDMMLGQYQLSDLMFPRETRLTFQDFMAYRMAGITYDRGLQFGRAFGPLDVALGVANGNGVTSNFAINSPGYQRADRIFDNDNSKSVYGRLGTAAGPVGLGVFALSGRQRSVAPGNAGLDRGLRNTDKRVVGLDLSGNIDEKLFLVRPGPVESLGRISRCRPQQELRLVRRLCRRGLYRQRPLGVFPALQPRRCRRPERHRHHLRRHRHEQHHPRRFVLLHAQRQGRDRGELRPAR